MFLKNLLFKPNLIAFYKDEETYKVLNEQYKKEEIIHPREYKEPKIMKSKYNKLKKLFLEKYPDKKFPEFPKSGKLTKQLKKISEEFKINLFKEN